MRFLVFVSIDFFLILILCYFLIANFIFKF